MVLYERDGNLNIWWFPRNFCQSRFGNYRESGMNSCTLISLIFADKVSKSMAFYKCVSKLPTIARSMIGNAINDGNNVYHDIFLANLNINVPDAILAIQEHQQLNFRLEEWFYTQLRSNPKNPLHIAPELSSVFHTTLEAYQHGCPLEAVASRLFAAIIADSRTVMVTIDFDTSIVAFVDSHKHGYKTGAVLVQTLIQHLDDLMFWFVSMLVDIFSSRPRVYEISFLTTMPDVAKRIPPAFGQFANKVSHRRKRTKKKKNVPKY